MFKTKISILSIIFLMLFALTAFAQNDLQKGRDAINRGDNVKAVEILSKVVTKEKDYDAYYLYGLALYRTGSMPKAEEFLKKALIEDDEGIGAMLTLGKLYSSQKKYADANNMFKRGLKIEPDNIDLMIAQSDNFSAQEKIDDAIKVLTLATTISKENPKVYVGLGDAYRIRGSFKLSADYYKKAIALKRIPEAYTGLGEAFAKQRKYNEALVEFNNAINIDPNYAPAYFGKGRILYFGGQFGDALEAFKKYSDLMPGSQEGNSYYAKVLYAQGVYYSDRNQNEPANEKFNEALKILEDVLKNDPKSSTGNLYTAYIYAEKSEIDEVNKTDFLNKAVDYFSKVDIKDYDKEDLQVLAKVNSNLQKFNDADKYFNMALGKDSLDYDTYYEWGKSLYKEEKFDNAIAKFQKSIDLGNPNAFATLYVGFCYYSQKNYLEAVPFFQKVVDSDPKFVLALEFLARAYRFGNKDQESINTYEKILQLEPENKEAIEMIKALKAKLGKQ